MLSQKLAASDRVASYRVARRPITTRCGSVRVDKTRGLVTHTLHSICILLNLANLEYFIAKQEATPSLTLSSPPLTPHIISSSFHYIIPLFRYIYKLYS